MALEDVPRCQHVKVNGVQCGSPALRRRRRCYFHEGIRLERKEFVADQFAQRSFTLPVLEDANAVQLTLMKVMQALVNGRMDYKMAGLMLYALQTASCNLRNVKFEAEKPTDVVIDPKDVDRTCLNGPQWFAQDFTEPGMKREDKKEEGGGAVAAGGEKVPAPARPRKIHRGEACRTVREEKIYPETGRMARAMKIEQESTVMHDLVYELFPEPFVRKILEAGPG
ncbi:MAG: hypothetical protein WAM04_08990 [Candidatus Sulfotelmatobacter sp.]